MFVVKVKNFYIDFDLHLAKPKLEGVDKEVYTMTWYEHTNLYRGMRGNSEDRPLTQMDQERRIMNSVVQWASNQAMNLIERSRHLRRQDVSVDDLVIRLTMDAYTQPKPEEPK